MSRQTIAYYLSIMGVDCAPQPRIFLSYLLIYPLPLLYPVSLGPFLVGGAGTKSALLKLV
jgi:hypothetical protein